MPIFDEKRYKNGPETESHIMIILRSTPSSTNRHKSGSWNEISPALLSNISFLIRAAFERDIEVVEEI